MVHSVVAANAGAKVFAALGTCLFIEHAICLSGLDQAVRYSVEATINKMSGHGQRGPFKMKPPSPSALTLGIAMLSYTIESFKSPCGERDVPNVPQLNGSGSVDS
jgi:hypothetical protein